VPRLVSIISTNTTPRGRRRPRRARCECVDRSHDRSLQVPRPEPVCGSARTCGRWWTRSRAPSPSSSADVFVRSILIAFPREPLKTTSCSSAWPSLRPAASGTVGSSFSKQHVPAVGSTGWHRRPRLEIRGLGAEQTMVVGGHTADATNAGDQRQRYEFPLTPAAAPERCAKVDVTGHGTVRGAAPSWSMSRFLASLRRRKICCPGPEQPVDPDRAKGAGAYWVPLYLLPSAGVTLDCGAIASFSQAAGRSRSLAGCPRVRPVSLQGLSSLRVVA